MATVTLDLDRRTHLLDPGGAGSPADHPSLLPRIIVRDRMGRVLDTDTSYQRTINAGRLKIARGSTDLTPEEWRLPHAPVPFKPDYSRVGPPVKERTGIGESRKTKEAEESRHGSTMESKLEDKVEEGAAKYRLHHPLRDPRTMNLLGHAGAFLAQVEREQSQTTYLPFTLSVPAGANAKTDQTNNPDMGEYAFPGFCTGCQRTSALVFCYGCERDSNPHYHQDKTGRTGGGFTYIKRDRPLFEMTDKNPINWRTMLTNGPYIFYDGLLVPSLEKYGVAARVDGLDKRPLHLRYPDQFQFGLDRLRSQSARDSNLLSSDQMYLLYPHPSDGTMAPTPVYDMDEDGDEEEEEGSWKEAGWESDSGRGGTVLDGMDLSGRERKGLEGLDETGEEEETEEGNKKDQGQEPEKKRLYQAPKAFQLKKREAKPTKAASPFSKERELSIPKYTGVDIRKSDKKPTEFININLGDASWKAPDAFTLKDREGSPDRELQRQPTKTEDHSLQRKSSAGAKLAPLVANKRSSGSSSKKSTESEISVDTGKPKKHAERPSSPDSGVGSVTFGPRTLSTVAKGLPGEMSTSAPTLVEEVKGHSTIKKAVKGHSTTRKVASFSQPTPSNLNSHIVTEVKPATQASRDISHGKRSVVIPSIAETVEEEDAASVKEPSPAASPDAISLPLDGAIEKDDDGEEEEENEKEQEEEKEEKEERSSISRRKSSVVSPGKSEDIGIASDAETEDEEEHPTDGKPRLKTKDVSKKEKSREQRRAQRKTTSVDERGGVETPTSLEEDSSSPEPEDGQPMIFKDHSLPRISVSKLPEPLPLPKIEPPFPPKLMEFVEPVKPIRDLSTTDIETPPPMVEPPRQRPPPPVLKDKRKSRRMSRPMMTFKRQVGAPVPIAEVKDIVDPLDWLAKYCIIHPDRLPLYLRVFSKAASEQVYRYADVPNPDDDLIKTEGGQSSQEHSDEAAKKEHDQGQGHSGQGLSGQGPSGQGQPEVTGVAPNAEQDSSRPQKTRLTEEEATRIHNLDCVGVALKPEYGMAGKNEGDLNIDKINYTLDVLIDKYETLQDQLDACTASKVKLLVDLTRKHFPELTNPSYDPKPKKTKKKNAKKSKKDTVEGDKSKQLPPITEAKPEPATPEVAAEQTPDEPKPFGDLDIIARLQEKHLNAFSKDADLCRLNLEITRLKEKLKDVDDRIDDLEDEKKLLQLYAIDEFLQHQQANAKPEKFMRKQSPLYQKLHPSMDVEMNLSELEEALQQVNGHLITRKELQYIFFILNIPGRRRIDVQLFSVIAALSEKVAQVDPFIRNLINKFDFEALHVKMERSKELFTLLTEDDDVDVPLGKVAAQMLGVELAAGGVSEEHTKYVLGKFNRENKGIVDFLDFLTYIPLFIEIHNRILDTPLGYDRSW